MRRLPAACLAVCLSPVSLAAEVKPKAARTPPPAALPNGGSLPPSKPPPVPHTLPLVLVLLAGQREEEAFCVRPVDANLPSAGAHGGDVEEGQEGDGHWLLRAPPCRRRRWYGGHQRGISYLAPQAPVNVHFVNCACGVRKWAGPSRRRLTIFLKLCELF